MATITTILKKSTLKANAFALKNTEKMVLKTIGKISHLQKKTTKTIERSLHYTEKKQENIFSNLEDLRGYTWKNLNKTLDFFSKS